MTTTATTNTNHDGTKKLNLQDIAVANDEDHDAVIADAITATKRTSTTHDRLDRRARQPARQHTGPVRPFVATASTSNRTNKDSSSANATTTTTTHPLRSIDFFLRSPTEEHEDDGVQRNTGRGAESEQQQKSNGVGERYACGKRVGGRAEHRSSAGADETGLLGAVVEDTETIPMGARLGIWWDGDRMYYPCTVVNKRTRKNKNTKEEQKYEWFLKYDDGTDEWLDLAREHVRWITDEDTAPATMAEDENTHQTTDTTRSSRRTTDAPTPSQKVPPPAPTPNTVLIKRYKIGIAKQMLLPNNDHAAIIPFSLVPNHSLPPNESQVKRTILDALVLEYNIMDQYYKKIESQMKNGELRKELLQQQRIKNTIISALSEKETADYARLKAADFETLSKSIDEDQKVLHHNTFKQLYDANLIRIIPANYLRDNRDPTMKNLHGQKQANLILCQNANHPNEIVYYATKNAFVISERLVKTKKPSTNTRLLFVCEENNASNRRKYFHYKQYRVLSKRRVNGYNKVDLRAQNNQSEMIINPYYVGAIILTVFSGISRKQATSNQGGVRQTVDHKTRNPSDDSYYNVGWANGSEQMNNRYMKRKRTLPRQHPKKSRSSKTGNKLNGSGHPDPISSSVRISKPSATDVLFGRGSVSGSHPGNRTYRKVIQSKSLMYDAAKTKGEKTFITLSIVHEMKEQLHLRFLKEDETTGLWIEVTNDKIARQKVVQALRDLRKTRRPPKSKQQEQKQQQHNHDATTRNDPSVDNITLLDKFNNESPGISTSKRKHRYDQEDNLPDNIDDVPPTDTSVFLQHKPQATAQDLAKEVITHYFRKHPKFDLLISHIYPTYIFDIEKRKFLNGTYRNSIDGPRRSVRFQKKNYQVSRLSAETRIGRELEPGEIVDHNDGNTINDSWDEIATSHPSGNTINNEDSRTGSGHQGIFQRGINLFEVSWTQGHHFARDKHRKSFATFEDAVSFRDFMYAEHMMPQVINGRALNVAWDTYVQDQQTQIVILQSLITYCQQLQHQSQQQPPEKMIWLQMLSDITEEAFQQQLNHIPVNAYSLSVYDKYIPLQKQKRQELQHQLNQQRSQQQLLRAIDPTLLSENETPIHELVQGFGEHSQVRDCVDFHMPLPIEHGWIVAGDVDWDNDNDNSDNNNDDNNDDYSNDDNDNDDGNDDGTVYENAEDDVGVETDVSVSNVDDNSIISDVSTGINDELERQLKSYRTPFRKI